MMMRRGKAAVVGFALIGGLALTGCGKSAKCKKAFANVETFTVGMAKSFGGNEDDAKKQMEAKKDDFLASCQKMPDDALDCFQGDLTKAMSDPKCKAALDNLPK